MKKPKSVPRRYQSALPQAWKRAVPDRPQPSRHRADGRLVRPSKFIGKRRHVIAVKHAGDSHGLRLGKFDLRRKEGRKYREVVAALTHHLGGPDELSQPQRELVDQVARLAIISGLAWDELSRSGAFRDGEAVPAVHTYRSVISDMRSILSMLGIQKKEREVPDLHEYLRARRKRLPVTLDNEADDAD